MDESNLIFNSEYSISVVLPTHNRFEFLKAALMSAINQSYTPCEIIVIDDYLLDTVRDLVQGFQELTDIPIRFSQNIIKANAQISRNIGAGQAIGKYIAFLDDDDLWDEDYLKKAKEVLSSKVCDVLITHTVAFENDNISNKFLRKLFPETYIEQDMFIKNPGIACSNVIVDRKYFIKIGGYDPYVNASADKDLLIRLKREGYVHEVLKEQLVFYRIGHIDQWSSSDIKILPDILRFYKKYFFSIKLTTHIKMIKKIIKIIIVWLFGINQSKK
ncbi:glycosyltransferase family 2 protein [Candidatus Thioglobus sp.]|nr:glycosyltransferase family 2 protein [Candidatus Thioglobus sp.]